MTLPSRADVTYEQPRAEVVDSYGAYDLVKLADGHALRSRSVRSGKPQFMAAAAVLAMGVIIAMSGPIALPALGFFAGFAFFLVLIGLRSSRRPPRELQIRDSVVTWGKVGTSEGRSWPKDDIARVIVVTESRMRRRHPRRRYRKYNAVELETRAGERVPIRFRLPTPKIAEALAQRLVDLIGSAELGHDVLGRR